MSSEAQVRTTNRATGDTDAARPALTGLANALPPHVWFCVSAIFHYLGPAFAVLLFAQVGLLWAFLSGALFVGYIVLGHRVAQTGIGITGLGTAMAVAFLVVLPVGFSEALPAFSAPRLLIAAIGVGVCSSVIPYICDQLAMARLPRASFALMLSLLPLTATLIGVGVLRQIPSLTDCLGIALVVAGVAMHKPAAHA